MTKNYFTSFYSKVMVFGHVDQTFLFFQTFFRKTLSTFGVHFFSPSLSWLAHKETPCRKKYVTGACNAVLFKSGNNHSNTFPLSQFRYSNSLSLSFACWKSSNINHLHLKLFLSLYMSVSIIFPSLQILFVARDVIFNSKDDFKYLFLDQEPWSRLINKSSKPGSLL